MAEVLETAELAALGGTPEWTLAWRHRMVERMMGRALEVQRTPLSSYCFTRAVRTETAGTFYVFQGQKDYGRRPWPDCDATVDFSGIVVQDSRGHVSVRSMDAYTTLDCSRDNAIQVAFEPLASLHWRGPTLWIVRLQSEDGFEYGLLNPAGADAAAVQLKGAWQLRRDPVANASKN